MVFLLLFSQISLDSEAIKWMNSKEIVLRLKWPIYTYMSSYPHSNLKVNHEFPLDMKFPLVTFLESFLSPSLNKIIKKQLIFALCTFGEGKVVVGYGRGDLIVFFVHLLSVGECEFKSVIFFYIEVRLLKFNNKILTIADFDLFYRFI